jgi:hypothetical protein
LAGSVRGREVTGYARPIPPSSPSTTGWGFLFLSLKFLSRP